MNLNEAKTEIISKFLDQILFDGASFATLEDACKQAGYDPSLAKILFLNHKAEVVEHLFVNAMDNAVLKNSNNEFKLLKIRQKVGALVIDFIKELAPYKLELRLLLKNLDPEFILNNIMTTYKISSEFWYECGDNSTDFNYYSKRFLLTCICSASLIYFLSSEQVLDEDNKMKTFIDWQIEQVMKIGKFKKTSLSYDFIRKIPFLRLIKFSKP